MKYENFPGERSLYMGHAFKILIHRNDDNAHFKLLGDFDTRAASELIDAIENFSVSLSLSRIFIHTDALDGVIDYDELGFKNRIYEIAIPPAVKILSTGRYSKIFTPLEGTCF